MDSIKELKAVDLLFLVDTTASMNVYSIEIKKLIKKMVWDIQRCISQFLLDEMDVLKVGLVSYRDHEDEGISYLTNIDINLTTDIKKFLNIAMALNFWGGKDEPEAVFDGLKVAINDVHWRKKSIKFIYHILDAPSHGKKYNDIKEDKYEKCPKNVNIEELLIKMRQKDIKYTIIKLNDSIDIMLKEFQKLANYEVISPNFNIDKSKIKPQV